MSLEVPIKIAILDDHNLFRKGLVSLIEILGGNYKILFEGSSGIDLQQKINKSDLPDIVLMDINMPDMDGFESVQWLHNTYPAVKVLIISMIEKEEVIVRMLKLGVKGYLCKDVEPDELNAALHAVANKGFYYTDFITGKLVHSLSQSDDKRKELHILEQLNDREKQFLQLACSDMTYNEIADKMCLSPKTIDGYRNNLFEKFGVKSRVGLALYAVRHELVELQRPFK